MIDLASESLIPILDTRKIVPVSVPTLRRWAASGKLETLRIGAKVFTSREAIARMAQHGPQPSHRPAPTPTKRAKFRSQQVDDAKAHLRAALGGY